MAEVCYDNKDRENCKWFTRKALMKRGRVPKHVRDFCDEEDPPAATSGYIFIYFSPVNISFCSFDCGRVGTVGSMGAGVHHNSPNLPCGVESFA